MWKAKFTSRKQYLFGLLFPRNAKKTHTEKDILQAFLLCLKRNVSQTFKVGPSPSKKNCVVCFNESPLKMMKIIFYFTLKLISFSRFLNFCFNFLAM